ncbi:MULTISPECIES: hypothetical protein [unclassified Desulfurobacterium]|uniref:hypothetical protein n=1 Tax=Desulfurobacterium sp. TC5-1 TaxID=1158318 RepID=UPI0003B4BBB9|nr:hypothetical protein [Desulfurobacterium sp. TC5-1]
MKRRNTIKKRFLFAAIAAALSPYAFAGKGSKSGSGSGKSIMIQNHGEEHKIRRRTRAGNCTGIVNATMNETIMKIHHQ